MFLKGTNWTKQLYMSLHFLRFSFLIWWGGKKGKKERMISRNQPKKTSVLKACMSRHKNLGNTASSSNS